MIGCTVVLVTVLHAVDAAVWGIAHLLWAWWNPSMASSCSVSRSLPLFSINDRIPAGTRKRARRD